MDISDLPEQKLFCQFEVIFDGQSIVLFASTLEEKQKWLKEIRQCIKVFLN